MATSRIGSNSVKENADTWSVRFQILWIAFVAFYDSIKDQIPAINDYLLLPEDSSLFIFGALLVLANLGYTLIYWKHLESDTRFIVPIVALLYLTTQSWSRKDTIGIVVGSVLLFAFVFAAWRPLHKQNYRLASMIFTVSTFAIVSGHICNLVNLYIYYFGQWKSNFGGYMPIATSSIGLFGGLMIGVFCGPTLAPQTFKRKIKQNNSPLTQCILLIIFVACFAGLSVGLATNDISDEWLTGITNADICAAVSAISLTLLIYLFFIAKQSRLYATKSLKLWLRNGLGIGISYGLVVTALRLVFSNANYYIWYTIVVHIVAGIAFAFSLFLSMRIVVWFHSRCDENQTD